MRREEQRQKAQEAELRKRRRQEQASKKAAAKQKAAAEEVVRETSRFWSYVCFSTLPRASVRDWNSTSVPTKVFATLG